MKNWRAVEIIKAETSNGRETSVIIFRQDNIKFVPAGLGNVSQLDNEYYFIGRKSRGTLCTVLLNYKNFCKLFDAAKNKKDIGSAKFSLIYKKDTDKYQLIFKGKNKLTLIVKQEELLNALVSLDSPEILAQELVKSLVDKELDKKKEEKIKRIMSNLLSTVIGEQIISILTEYESYALAENIYNNMTILSYKITCNLKDFDEQLSTEQNKIKEFGSIITTLPFPEDSGDDKIAFIIIFAVNPKIIKMAVITSVETKNLKQLYPK